MTTTEQNELKLRVEALHNRVDKLDPPVKDLSPDELLDAKFEETYRYIDAKDTKLKNYLVDKITQYLDWRKPSKWSILFDSFVNFLVIAGVATATTYLLIYYHLLTITH